MHSQYSVRFDVASIIDHLGGVTAVHDMLARAGSTINIKTVYKWAERESIPADAIATIIIAANRDCVEFDIGKFIMEAQDG